MRIAGWIHWGLYHGTVRLLVSKSNYRLRRGTLSEHTRCRGTSVSSQPLCLVAKMSWKLSFEGKTLETHCYRKALQFKINGRAQSLCVPACVHVCVRAFRCRRTLPSRLESTWNDSGWYFKDHISSACKHGVPLNMRAYISIYSFRILWLGQWKLTPDMVTKITYQSVVNFMFTHIQGIWLRITYQVINYIKQTMTLVAMVQYSDD